MSPRQRSSPTSIEGSPVRQVRIVGVEPDPGGTGRDQVEQLWRDEHLDLRRFCVAIAGVADGEELAVEVFLRCVPKLLDGQVRSPKAYLRVSALNAVRSLHRKRGREVLVESDSTGRWVHDDAPSDWSHVRDAIGDLSPRQRAVVFLAYWEGLREREIAEQLGVTYGTVRRLMHRAQTRLRSELS